MMLRYLNMGVNTEVYNLWIKNGSGALDFKVCPLFVILLLTCPINLWSIFKFHDERGQQTLCYHCAKVYIEFNFPGRLQLFHAVADDQDVFHTFALL